MNNETGSVRNDRNKKWVDLETPRRLWPRKVKAGILGGVLGVYGQPLIGMAAWNRSELIPGQVNVTAGAFTTNVSDNVVGFTRGTRAAPGVATQDSCTWGLMSIHGYLDPAGPDLGQTLICQDLCYTDPAVGTSWYAFGWWNTNTSADSTSLVGVAWVGDPTTGNWMATVKDGTATPSNSLHSYDSGAARITLARLGIALNGYSHSVGFYLNGALVSSYTPAVVPAQFGTAGVYFGFAMITNAAATGRFNVLGGGNPRLLTIVEV